MARQHPRPLARAGAVAAILTVAWGGVAALDRVIDWVQRRAETAAPAPAPPVPGGAGQPAAAGRAFVLLIDSLRAETAEALPALQALRPHGLLVRVRATQDAATVPSLRAAFTGKPQPSLLAFADNFRRGGGALPSIFSQLAGAGGAAAVFSDGGFRELAAGIARLEANEVPPGDEQTRQTRAFAKALALFRAGPERLVVFHLTTTDHAAHAAGVADPRYREAFAAADALIGRADAAVLTGETLVVMGDHGHDRAGRHLPGLDVPTVAVYRGPGFRAGTEIGPLPLTIHRYLLSWALGLPLAGDYRGDGAPRALAGRAPLPAAFAAPPPAVSSVPLRLPRLLGLLAVVAALAGAGAALARRRRGLPPAVGVSIGVGAGLAFVAWGVWLAHRRLSLPPPSTREIWGAWLIVLALACAAVASGRARRTTVAWAALAVPGLLLYPSAAWDGWAATMAPAWLVALAVLAVDWARRRPGGRRPSTTPAERLALAALPLIALLVLRFFYAEAESFVFGGWRGYLTSERLVYWITAGTVARLVVFVRPGRGAMAVVVGLALVALLSLVSFADGLGGQGARLAAAALLAGAALAAQARARAAARVPGADRGAATIAALLTNAALLVAYRATVALDERTFLELELLLAALRLTALVSTALGRPEERRRSLAWLEAMGLLVAAWSTLALTLHRLEWGVLYRFFAPALVERHVGLFLPVIVARYAIPLVLARRLLAEARPAGEPGTWSAGAGALAVKIATLVLIAAGYAVLDPTSEPFLMAVQNLLSLSPLALALLYEPPGAVSTAHLSSR